MCVATGASLPRQYQAPAHTTLAGVGSLCGRRALHAGGSDRPSRRRGVTVGCVTLALPVAARRPVSRVDSAKAFGSGVMISSRPQSGTAQRTPGANLPAEDQLRDNLQVTVSVRILVCRDRGRHVGYESRLELMGLLFVGTDPAVACIVARPFRMVVEIKASSANSLSPTERLSSVRDRLAGGRLGLGPRFIGVGWECPRRAVWPRRARSAVSRPVRDLRGGG